jgi:hypothetical protein
MFAGAILLTAPKINQQCEALVNIDRVSGKRN